MKEDDNSTTTGSPRATPTAVIAPRVAETTTASPTAASDVHRPHFSAPSEEERPCGSSPSRNNISPPTTARLSPSSSICKVEPIRSDGWGRTETSHEGGSSRRASPSPPSTHEKLSASDDAPPELDALRPTFSKQGQVTRIPSRRGGPVTLAPVGVGGGGADSSPLPSLFVAAPPVGGSAGAPASDSSGRGGNKKAWGNSSSPRGQQHHQQWRQPATAQYSRQFAELAHPRRSIVVESSATTTPATTPPTPTAHVVTGMRARTETDPGPSRALSEVTKIDPSVKDAGTNSGSGDGSNNNSSGGGNGAGGAREYLQHREGSRRLSYIHNRSVSSGEAPSSSLHQASGLEGRGGVGSAGHSMRRSSSGGEVTNGPGGRVGVEGGGYSENNRRSSFGGSVERANLNGGVERTSVRGGGSANTAAVERGAVGSSGGGSNSSNIGPARMRMRGRFEITDLLTENADTDEAPATARNDEGSTRHGSASGHGNPASPYRGYHRQDSTASASSVGDLTYSSLGGVGGGGGGGGSASAGPSRSGTPSVHTPRDSEQFRADWPGGRPPLVRKRSLTVAMDADPGGGGGAVCPSPRGRRRSVDGVLDTKDDRPSDGGNYSARLESPSHAARQQQQQQQQQQIATSHPVASGHIAIVGGGSGSSGGSGGGGGFSPYHAYPSPLGSGSSAHPSPSHERPAMTVGGAGGGVHGGAGGVGHGHVHGGPNASGMDVEWIPNENTHGGAMPSTMTATPSPVPSLASVPSASTLGRQPSPFAPSPGREYLRVGGPRGTQPHSPSPRRAPPSPAQAPGSAGLRRRGTRRISGGRSAGRGLHSRVSVGKGGVYAGGGSGEIVGGSSGAYESDNDSDWSGSELSAYSAMGSIERQMQQDTFFELDETLWRVVPRRELCRADNCVYRNAQTMISIRKHYHATCSHIHQEGSKKGMRFHHHQLEKVKKHQRSHSSHLARVPRDHVVASPSTGMVGRNSIEAQSPRDPISSGGEDDGDEEEPWSARDVDLLHSLVRTYGVGSWGQISGRFANRSPTECARQWAIGPRAQLPPEHATGAVASIPVGGAGHAGIGGRWGISLGEHQQYHHHQQQQHHHHYHHHLAHQGGGGIATVAPADGSSLAAAAAAAATAGLGTGPRSSDRMPPDFSQAARQARGMPASAAAAGLAGVVPFGSPGGGMGGSGSSGRGPKGVGSWTKEEDDRLNNLVAMYGVKWSQISDHMPGRVGKQCRERYLNHLDPSLRHGPWTEEEEALLLSLHSRLNNQWAEIARQIPGRSDNDVKNRWNLVCRRERAAEKSLQRANSGSSATRGSPSAAGAPPRHGRTLSSGTAETAAAAAIRGLPPAEVVNSRGGTGGIGVDDESGASGRVNRSLPVSPAVSSEEQQSMIEAREAAEASAGLVKLSLTAASTARAALEHSNFDAGGAPSASAGTTKSITATSSSGGSGGSTTTPAPKRSPTPPISPRLARGHQQPVPMVSPRFARGAGQHHSSASSPPATVGTSPRFVRSEGHPPRSPTRTSRSPSHARGQSMTPPLPGYRGSGGGGGGGSVNGPLPGPPQSPYSPRRSGHQPLAIPRSPASENVRAAVPVNRSSSHESPGGHGGGRRAQGVAADVDARRAAIARRAAAAGGVATWAWGGRV